jgi:hypothetical protein
LAGIKRTDLQRHGLNVPNGNRGNTDQIARRRKKRRITPGVSGAFALEKRDFKKRQ